MSWHIMGDGVGEWRKKIGDREMEMWKVPNSKFVPQGEVKCIECGKNNKVTDADRKKGFIICVRCGEKIGVAK